MAKVCGPSQRERDVTRSTLRLGRRTQRGTGFNGQGVAYGGVLADDTARCDRNDQEMWGVPVLPPSPSESPGTVA